MPNDNDQLVRTRELSWREIVQRTWGKEWTKPDPAYEFSSGRTFEEPTQGGPYGPQE